MTLNENFVIVCAFRYALGRQTYGTGIVSEYICDNWNDLSRKSKKLIQREIKEAIKENRAGMDCDMNNWKEVLKQEFTEATEDLIT